MLDLSALSQLQQLKQQIQASVIRKNGIVKGTSKRFGFVIDEKDGQQYLLPQASMDLVLPNDRVEFILEKSQGDDDRPIASVEKLLKTEFEQFTGEVKCKGNNYFVAGDLPFFNRWVFIPPKFHDRVKEGDLVLAKITQHPFNNKGRTQCEITTVLGRPDDPFIEHRYAIAKEGIAEKIWQPDEIEAIRQTSERSFERAAQDKTDCREQLFITIDGVSTQDLDDALAIEKTEQGWLLSVAIADASSFITPDSPLDKIAARQASTIYLPGQKIPMLPDVLSADLCSLRADKDRLALICQLHIHADGSIHECRYIDAIIRSKAKLNYDDVSVFLQAQESSYSDEIKQTLQMLYQLSLARSEWRKNHAQAPESYPDYRLWLNERGKIVDIEHLERNCAQSLVEECMIACNEATAQFLSKHTQEGLFLIHDGFRAEQLASIESLINNHLPESKDQDFKSLAGYLTIQKQSEQNPLPIREILRKKLTRSMWSNQAKPHFGLGLPLYTTFTSPLRKYSDLIVHRLIKAILHQETLPTISDNLLEQLNQATQAIRNAQRDCELSLKCQYLQDYLQQEFIGEISMISNRAVSVYLADFDIFGNIDVRSLGAKFDFKQDTLQLVSDDLTLQLLQNVRVKVEQIDVFQRNVKLSLVEAL